MILSRIIKFYVTVRITGIIVPKEIKEKRLALAAEKAEKVLVEEQNKRLTAQKLHEEAMAKKETEIKFQKAKAENDIKYMNMEAEREAKIIEFDILVKEGNARSQKIRAEAAALTDMDKLNNYYKLEEMKALSEGTKMIYWGDSLPNTVINRDTLVNSN